MKLIVNLLLLLLFFGAQNTIHAAPTVHTGVVTRVVDGDTVWVKSSAKAANAGVLKVRIQGIDAPESCQPGGAESHAALRGYLLGQSVTLTSPTGRSRDDYGRLLARVDKQGQDAGLWLVRNGHAWSYGYRKNPGPYGAEQARAQAARLGLFARAAPENPRSFRKRNGSCYSKR